MPSVRGVVVRFSAVGREGGDAVAVPVVACLGQVFQAVAPEVVGHVPVEVEPLEEEVVALGVERPHHRLRVVVGFADVVVETLHPLARVEPDKFRFQFVKPPFFGRERCPDHEFFETVVVAADAAVAEGGERHLIVVVRRNPSPTGSPLQMRAGDAVLVDGVEAMGVVASHLVGRVEVVFRIFLRHHIDRTAQRTAAELVGHDAFVDFDALNHVGRNVVDVHKIAHLPHRRFVDKHPHALSFQSAHRDARGAAHTAGGAHRHAGHALQHAVEGGGRAFQLLQPQHAHREWCHLCAAGFGHAHHGGFAQSALAQRRFRGGACGVFGQAGRSMRQRLRTGTASTQEE